MSTNSYFSCDCLLVAFVSIEGISVGIIPFTLFSSPYLQHMSSYYVPISAVILLFVYL